MRTVRLAMALAGVLCLIGLLSAPRLAAQPVPLPKQESQAGKPPWQRLLQGADARRVAELDKKVVALWQVGRFAQGQAAEREIAAIRARVQGADHWQTADARRLAEMLGRAARLPAAAQAEFARLPQLDADAADLQNKDRYTAAEPLLRKALALRRKVLGEEHPLTAQGYNEVASNLKSQGHYAEAQPLYQKALVIRRKVLGEEHPLTAQSYNNLALNLNARGQHTKAGLLYQQALVIRRRVLGEEHPDTAASYNNMAHNLNAQGKYTEAAPLFQKALATFRKVLGEEHRLTALSYNNLAYTVKAQGQYAEAAILYWKALIIYRKVLGDEHPDTAPCYNNLAANLAAQGKNAEATLMYQKALAIWRRVLGEEHPHTATGYNNVALNLNAQGKYAEAAPLFQKALATFRKVLGEEHPLTALSYNNLACNLCAQSKYAEAEPLYRKALAIWQTVLGEEHPHTAASYNNLACTLTAQGKDAEAISFYRKALTIARKVLGEEHPHTAASYDNLGYHLVAQGQYAEAAALCQKALAVRRKVLGEGHPDTALSYSNVAYTLNAEGQYAEAEDLWRRAAVCFAKARLRFAPSGLERAAKTGEASPLVYLAAVLARNSKPEEAWQRFEEGLARGTWDDLVARLRRTPAEQAKQAQLIARLDRLDKLIARTFTAKEATPEVVRQRKELLGQQRLAQEELAAFAQELEKKYGPAAGQVFDRKTIQACLPPDTALVGWLDIPGQPKAKDPNGEHWAVLLRSAGEPVFVRLRGSGPEGDWTEFDTHLPADLRAALQAPAGKWQPLAQRLRKQRLEPLAKYLAAHQGLPAVRHLLILPSTALAGAPVEVIADKYAVSYALSATLYTHLRKQPPPATQGLLALADPAFGKESAWRRLPGTRLEVEGLRRLFPKAEVLLGSQASEQRLYELTKDGKLGHHRYVHLATHGVVDNQVPLRSAVILARDALPDPLKQLQAGLPVFDGRLTADKVLRTWRLHSDLVILSACQTALGKYEEGEGYVGFAQALIMSGSRSVCLSLWKVDDTATALLMTRFYENLLGKRPGLKGPLGKATALAEAKRWLRELPGSQAEQLAAALAGGELRGTVGPLRPVVGKRPPVGQAGDHPFSHPYYWAAFILIGDPD
jgi:CHAT domain-containing protein/tetratricopeptide (TPR) repeat protein